MNLSQELQIGKAAEHLVACDLLLQGLNAFLADQGLPFDVVVLHQQRTFKVHVKSRTRPGTTNKNSRSHYRFGLRHAKGHKTNYQR